MRITKEIEYVIIEGKPTLDLYAFDNDSEINVLEVEFKANPTWQDDGIGSYEYWGCKGYDSHPYLSCEEHGIEWDKKEFTEQENEMIDEWLNEEKNFKSLEEKFCEKYEDYNYNL
jgi:hypothetical protein